MKKVIIFLVVIAILAIGFFVGYRYYYKKDDNALRLSGELEMKQVELAFKVSGTLSDVKLSEGETVKKDDLIAVLDDEVYATQLKLAEANEKTAKYGLDELKDNLKRAGQKNNNLVKKTESQVEAATLNKELAAQQLKYTKLSSPIDGKIISVYKEVGELVQAGYPVVTVGNPKELWLRAYLPENKFSSVKIGDNMTIKVDSFEDKTFKGKISFISDKPEFTPKQIQTSEERVKLVYMVKIQIQDSEGLLKPGIPADAYVEE